VAPEAKLISGADAMTIASKTVLIFEFLSFFGALQHESVDGSRHARIHA
jgi:hypothetical protein